MPPKVVALGGGHGLAATLSALRALTHEITAIVTVADNGGSSGLLRDEFKTLPPGDLRMALAALCSDDDWGRNWAQILQYRFTSSGPMNSHAVGNLLLTALWDRDGDAVAGIAQVGDLLKIIGRVLPMALDPLDIEGTFLRNGVAEVVRGQVEVALAKGELQALRLIPENPRSTPEALRAIEDADWITIGPGSWFSSVMPHFLLKEQAAAISNSKAKKIIVLNLPENIKEGEFAGSSAQKHLELVLAHTPALKIDFAIADEAVVAQGTGLSDYVASLGGKLISADVGQLPGGNQHDVAKMSRTFSHIFEGTLLK
jgi:2-phospho-L-lactate transferase/gluconeogenesis factor (CofD/UPF0052 family)